MDQDSFRQLLSGPGVASASTSRPRSSLFSKPIAKAKTVDASEPAFKPRKVKKQSVKKYRDRASERRGGLDNDYTEVEAVLEDFEKRNKDNEDRLAIEEQRKYLGGDGDHSILVKGLDFALLEQNKAKVAVASGIEDDESLEQAFLEATSAPIGNEVTTHTIIKKRTRQDLIRELKEKRENGSGVVQSAEPEKREIGIEEAKKAGKFKPIGLKPIGDSEGKGTKRKKKEKDGEKNRKKSKIEPEKPVEPAPPEQVLSLSSVNTPTPVEGPDQEPLDPDFDIFADVEEYTGLDVDDDDEEENVDKVEDRIPDGKSEPGLPSGTLKRGWFDEAKEPTPPPAPQPEPLSGVKEQLNKDMEVEEDQPSMRLAPLASSSVPSVKDILAMDEAAEKAEKRKARKEKRKEKKELSAEGKVSRDYQKLMAYEKKKSK